MAFNSINRQFTILDQFAAYLATLPPPDWPGEAPVGSTYHNTFIPNIVQWRGLASMRSKQACGYALRLHYLVPAFTAPARQCGLARRPDRAGRSPWAVPRLCRPASCCRSMRSRVVMPTSKAGWAFCRSADWRSCEAQPHPDRPAPDRARLEYRPGRERAVRRVAQHVLPADRTARRPTARNGADLQLPVRRGAGEGPSRWHGTTDHPRPLPRRPDRGRL